MTTETQTDNGTEQRVHNDRLIFYHANGQGTGAAVQLELRINQRPGERYNCFFLELARQKTVARRGDGGTTHATFDWENKITVKLDFTDVCEFLGVLEGECEHVGGKRQALYHQNGDANTMIRFSRHESGGVALSVSRKSTSANQPNRIGTVLSRTEALGLRQVLRMGLFVITFPGVFFGGRG